MAIIHIISWLALLAIIPLTALVLLIKNRGALSCWIRLVDHPERWLLATKLAAGSTKEDINSALKKVVSQARNSEWHASCTSTCRDHVTGEWIIGLISTTRPTDEQVPAPYSFSKLPATHVIRASGQPRDEGATIKGLVNQWAENKGIQYDHVASSLTAQAFQCWEWDISTLPEAAKRHRTRQIEEKIFEMRDILLYPILFTVISLIMCGTGSPWLFGIGIFLVILMSGACKFVCLHQREDITQESHLQNY